MIISLFIAASSPNYLSQRKEKRKRKKEKT
jgi:hypothetical protein